MALSSINKSRPAGNWAKIEYKGAVNVGTFNWNESNPNVLTVFDSDHNEIFKIVKEQQKLQHTEKGFWESLWENVSGWLDFDIEGSGGGSQPGGIRFYAEGASGSLLKAGNDLRVVQVFAGHKNPSATEKYKQAQLKELKRAVLNYHPLKSNPQIPKKR